MRVIRESLRIVAKERMEFLDITERIRDLVRKYPVRDGVVLVNSLHTTVALFVNEFQGALIEDFKHMVSKLIPEQDGYRHDDPRYSDCGPPDAHAHLRATLLGRSVAIALSGGELCLGQFESIIFAELKGPGQRGIDIQIMGE